MDTTNAKLPSRKDEGIVQRADPLILTKLRPPFIRPGGVSRPRLQEMVLQGLRGPLTLITAPAGFGKTTLVASCVAGAGTPFAWLSLDGDDNQPGRFLAYLVAALGRMDMDQGVAREAAQLAGGIQPASPGAVLTSLINDLETTSADCILVLDDYQFIHSADVHEAMTFLIEHCPQTLHLVIATRSDPPLPLARLRARGQTVELRAADLRFRETEAAEFLNEVMRLGLDAGAVSALEERTEGWIAGLQMAALSVRDREDKQHFIAGFSGTDRYILDYLLEEVLASQSPEIQRFLIYTSVLERFTAPLCDALLRDENLISTEEASAPTFPVAQLLEALERENLFLVALDDTRTWFRYHHLFADLLRVRLGEAHPGLAPRLHLRASAWLERQGLVPEAIRHLFAAQEMERAADLIERYGPAYLARSDPSLFQLADELPAGVLLTRPRLGLYRAWLLIIWGEIGKVLPLLYELERRLAATDTDTGEGWMRLVVALALAFLIPAGSTPAEEPLPEEAQLDDIPPEERILRNAADFLYGMALARRGLYERAIEVAQGCLQRERTLRGTRGIPTLAPFLSRMYLMQGRLRETASLCRAYLDPIKESGARFVMTSASMEIDLGEALYEWDRLEEAEGHIREGLRVNRPWQNIMADGFGLAALARVLGAQGDHSGAMRVVDQLEERLKERSRPRELEEDYRTLRVRTQLAGGDLHIPSLWADQVQFSEDFSLHPERYRLTLARVRLAQGRYTETENLLSGVALPFAAGSQVARQVTAELSLAAALAGQGRNQEAMGRLETSLSLAEPEGYIRVFLDLGQPARDLLAAYLKSGAPEGTGFARKVLESFSPSACAGSATPQSDGLVEALTERELEVLRLMALGKTNEEIAGQLVVARGTVKAHAASIYRKLEAANRTEAVARARGLGLLS